MKTTIVTGLLGSGKTTFIRNRLQNSSEKTVVLVNDFGKAGIDGEIFSADGIESVELPSGCVCCSLKFDLITTITRIVKEFSPEHLVIEPSGIASPSGVLEALESAGIGSYSVIGIVDVTEFAELYQSGMYGRFFEDQVASSDVILVNKTDLVDEDKIDKAIRLIESINPRSVLFRTVQAVVIEPLPSFRHSPSFQERNEIRTGLNRLPFVKEQEAGKQQRHILFDTLSFKLNNGTRLSHFSDLFDHLAQGRFGTVVRAKALIHSDAGSIRFDAVYGKVDQTRFEQEVTDSRLVVIGEGLDRTGIERRLSGG